MDHFSFASCFPKPSGQVQTPKYWKLEVLPLFGYSLPFLGSTKLPVSRHHFIYWSLLLIVLYLAVAISSLVNLSLILYVATFCLGGRRLWRITCTSIYGLCMFHSYDKLLFHGPTHTAQAAYRQYKKNKPYEDKRNVCRHVVATFCRHHDWGAPTVQRSSV